MTQNCIIRSLWDSILILIPPMKKDPRLSRNILYITGILLDPRFQTGRTSALLF